MWEDSRVHPGPSLAPRFNGSLFPIIVKPGVAAEEAGSAIGDLLDVGVDVVVASPGDEVEFWSGSRQHRTVVVALAVCGAAVASSCHKAISLPVWTITGGQKETFVRDPSIASEDSEVSAVRLAALVVTPLHHCVQGCRICIRNCEGCFISEIKSTKTLVPASWCWSGLSVNKTDEGTEEEDSLLFHSCFVVSITDCFPCSICSLLNWITSSEHQTFYEKSK